GRLGTHLAFVQSGGLRRVRRAGRIDLESVTVRPNVATIRAMTDGEIPARRIRRAELEQLVHPSVLPPGEALELIGGELVSAERQSPWHYAAIRKTARALVAAFGPGWDV